MLEQLAGELGRQGEDVVGLYCRAAALLEREARPVQVPVGVYLVQ